MKLYLVSFVTLTFLALFQCFFTRYYDPDDAVCYDYERIVLDELTTALLVRI